MSWTPTVSEVYTWATISTVKLVSSSPLCVPYIIGLPHNETTLAELVKLAGYTAAHLGKWHLGVGENFQYLPTTQGFDYYLVYIWAP